MVSLYVQGPVTEENIINIKSIINESEGIISECYWVYTIHKEYSLSAIDHGIIRMIPVEDPGNIEVAVPPHYANTNRMIATTKKIIDLRFSTKNILKIRSDISLENNIKFIEWIKNVDKSIDKIHVVTRANHNWSLPFNIGDWIFFGHEDYLKELISKLKIVHPNSGMSGKINLSRLLYGYCKYGFSPMYTTEQVVGSMIFDFNDEINSAKGFKSWVKIKNDKIQKYYIHDIGLQCKKHNHHVSNSIDHSSRVLYALFNLLKNLVRLIIR